MLDTRQLDMIIREGEGLTVEFKEHFTPIFYRSPEFALKEKEGDRSPKLVEGLADKLVERLVEGLAENQKKVLILIARNPRISKKVMAQSLGISQPP